MPHRPRSATRSPTSRPPTCPVATSPAPLDVLDTPTIVGKVLWARSASEAESEAVRQSRLGAAFCIYGHDVTPEGFEKGPATSKIVVSTSFGVFDSNKVYVSLDLAAKYRSVHELRIGHELLPLYPDKAPPRLGGRAKSR